MGETPEALGLGALVPPARFVAGDEIVEIGTPHRPLFQREAPVRAQIVDPELLGVRLGRDPLLVEEQYVRLDPLPVENAGRQSQESVEIEIVQQAAADRLAGARPGFGDIV